MGLWTWSGVWSSFRPLRKFLNFLAPKSVSLSEPWNIKKYGLDRFVTFVGSGLPGYERSVPKTQWPFVELRHFFVCRDSWRLDGVVVDLGTGAVRAQGHLIRDLKTNHYAGEGEGCFRLPSPKKTVRLDGAVLVAGQRIWNYYHWLIEDLPAILCASENTERVRVLVSKRAPRYVISSLELAGLDYLPGTGHLSVNNLLVLNRGYDPGWARAEDIDRLRRVFLPDPERSSARKLFVSRARSSRTLQNENDLEKDLVSLGFSVVHAEDLAFSDQVRLFSEAKVIVGSHGAGLSNAVWTKPGTQVVELATEENPNPCFEFLSRELALNYRRVVVPTTRHASNGILTDDGRRRLTHMLGAM